MNFILSHTNKDLGISHVAIKHRNKYYHGYANLHPDDKDNWSEFTGCRYAEIRAQIAALKNDLREKKESCEECRKFVKAIEQYKQFNKNDATAKAMYRQLNRRIREVNVIVDKINALKFSLNVAIKNQDYVNKKFKKG